MSIINGSLEFACKTYQNLIFDLQPDNLQYHAAVAYLDDDCWEIVEKIVDKMRKGQIHGKKEPTTATFRFLKGSQDARGKKKLLEEYLKTNSTGPYHVAKKKSRKPKVSNVSIVEL